MRHAKARRGQLHRRAGPLVAAALLVSAAVALAAERTVLDSLLVEGLPATPAALAALTDSLEAARLALGIPAVGDFVALDNPAATLRAGEASESDDGSIHFPMGDENGKALGRCVGRVVLKRLRARWAAPAR